MSTYYCVEPIQPLSLLFEAFPLISWCFFQALHKLVLATCAPTLQLLTPFVYHLHAFSPLLSPILTPPESSISQLLPTYTFQCAPINSPFACTIQNHLSSTQANAQMCIMEASTSVSVTTTSSHKLTSPHLHSRLSYPQLYS